MIEIDSWNVVQDSIYNIWNFHHASGAESIDSTCTPAISIIDQSKFPQIQNLKGNYLESLNELDTG